MKLLLVILSFALTAKASERTFSTAIQNYGSSNFWSPSTFVVYEGDTVELKFIDSNNQLKIDNLDIDGISEENLTASGEKMKRFVAPKAGVYNIRQNSPSEVNGQVIVLQRDL